MRVPKHIRDVLEEAGVKYVVTAGGRHYHVRVAGHLVTVFHGGAKKPGGRADYNDVMNLKKNLRRIGYG